MAPRNVERLIIDMDVPASGTSLINVTQGASIFDDFVTQSTDCCSNPTPAHAEWVSNVVAP
ncbi:MAG TPA: hypothetical protein VEM57_01790 [Candidatus Binatus sp.]|nr:hypothetical protein [Candidatus Binatus sp.]